MISKRLDDIQADIAESLHLTFSPLDLQYIPAHDAMQNIQLYKRS